jgi:isocitrate dehydrogenase (NAD+)
MYRISLIPGDGIGPEIVDVVIDVFKALNISVEWEIVNVDTSVVDKSGTPLYHQVIESIKRNRIALKGPITTPIASGFRSINVSIRKELDLYANLRLLKSLPGIDCRYKNVDMVIVRENTEGLYSGIEHMVGDDAAESIKIITKKASLRIARYGFEYARKNKRKLLTAVHKANILKLSDGLFLKAVREVARDYPEIKYNERIIDNMCMQMVLDPGNYDVLVLPNLYGDIISDLGAGLIGGLGLIPGANIGSDIAVFEPVHGSAPDITGKGIANPIAILRSSIMLLDYISEKKAARSLENSIKTTLKLGKGLTPDLGGNGTTDTVKEKIIKNLK